MYNKVGGLENKKKYKYQFDTHKNWINKIKYVNDEPKYIIERELEYFK
jgi:hypothetical protein